MKSMEITSWPVESCHIAEHALDSIFSFEENNPSQSPFQKPYLGIKKGKFVEIIIDRSRFVKSTGKIPVYLVSNEISLMEMLEVALDYYLFDHELTPINISAILHYLEEKDIEENKQKKFISQKLRISPKPKIIEKYKKYINLNESLRQFLIMKKAPLKVWDYLTEFSQEEQNFLQQIISDLRPSLGNFLEIVENLSEAQKITGKTFSEIFKELGLIQMLSNDSSSKLADLKDKIQILRYPTLTNHRKEINQLFSEIIKPNNLNLQYDSSFEKKVIRGFISITKEEDFDALERFFSKENKEKLNEILKRM